MVSMPRFKLYKHDQNAMVVNYQHPLQPGTFAHAVRYLIEHKLDLSVFHSKYRNAATARLAKLFIKVIQGDPSILWREKHSV
ncbi:MAG: transposase [Halomonas sp.]|nr:transposase [Halomonas sp.]